MLHLWIQLKKKLPGRSIHLHLLYRRHFKDVCQLFLRFSLGPQASLEEMEDFESVCQQFVSFQEEMESVSKKFANIEAMAPLIEELSNKVSVFVSRCTGISLFLLTLNSS